MSSDDLKKKVHEMRAELSRELAAVASGTRPENPGRIKELKRTIARILTILNSRGVEL